MDAIAVLYVGFGAQSIGASIGTLIGALVGIDVSKVENTCVADIRGRSINNSSVTFRPFINIAGDYHSSPCIHVPTSSNLTYSHK